MIIKIILSNDGSMALAVEDQNSTFEEAQTALARLRAVLGNLPITYTSDVERHLHQPDLHQIRLNLNT